MLMKVISVETVGYEKTYHVSDIKRIVCDYYKLDYKLMKSPKRAVSISHPRMICMWLCLKYTNCGYSGLKQYFNKDHTTIMNAKQRVDAMIADSIIFAKQIEYLESLVKLGKPDVKPIKGVGYIRSEKLMTKEQRFMRKASFDDNVDTVSIGAMPSRNHTGIDIKRG
ncbi:MAG: hypothetical protein MRY32_06600 [Rickettsiales bacterium]|nr:hypothetical protein [Rickettsiales bacterium]